MDVAPDLVRTWDDALRGVLQSCTRGAVTERAFELACLPVSDGGLGIPRLGDRADAVHVATHANAMALLPTVCPKTAGLFEDPTVSGNSWDMPVAAAWARVLAVAPSASTVLDFSSPMADTSLQRRLVHLVTRRRVGMLRQSLTPEQRASMTSHGGDGYCWFGATPTHTHYSFTNDSFSTSIELRLAISYPGMLSDAPCRRCGCGKTGDLR